MKKYVFTDETKEVDGVTFHRIQAVRTFSHAKIGDVGGWIEDESCLSHEGDCWVGGNAMVFSPARVKDDAVVRCDAVVKDMAVVCEHARVTYDAKITDECRIGGYAQVGGYAVVGGTATVAGQAIVAGLGVRITGNAVVKGKANIYGNAFLHGHAVVEGESLLDGNVEVCDNARILSTVHAYGNTKLYGDVCFFSYLPKYRFDGEADIKSNDDFMLFDNMRLMGDNKLWKCPNCSLSAYRLRNGDIGWSYGNAHLQFGITKAIADKELTEAQRTLLQDIESIARRNILGLPKQETEDGKCHEADDIIWADTCDAGCDETQRIE